VGKANTRPCQHPLTAIRQVTARTIYCRKCNRYATLPEVNNGTGPTEEVREEDEVSPVVEEASARVGGLDDAQAPAQGEAEVVEDEAPARIIIAG